MLLIVSPISPNVSSNLHQQPDQTNKNNFMAANTQRKRMMRSGCQFLESGQHALPISSSLHDTMSVNLSVSAQLAVGHLQNSKQVEIHRFLSMWSRLLLLEIPQEIFEL